MKNQIIECLFSNQQVFRQHIHMEFELIYVLQGSLTLNVNEKPISLGSEDFYLINTSLPHSWHAETSVLVGSLIIPFDLIHQYVSSSPVLFACYSAELSDDAKFTMRNQICKIFNYSHADDNQNRLLYDMACLQLLYLITNTYQAPMTDPIRNIPSKDKDKRAFELIRYIGENYASDLSLSSVADHFHLTPQYLSRYFKERFGTTFVNYIKQLRLEHALKDMLSTDKSLTIISMEHGFPNTSSFIHAFKETYQMTPTEYRTRHRTTPKHSSDTSLTQAVSTPDSTEALSSQVMDYLQAYNFQENTDLSNISEKLKVSNTQQAQDESVPLRKPWKKLLNIGNSSNLIRYDLREQLRYCREELHLEYVYINNLLHPNMKIHLDKSTGRYNFSEVRKALDYIISLGMHPYIELESSEITPRITIDEHVLTANIRSYLEYLYKNFHLFDSLIRFLVNRYGQEELSHWYFSLERSSADQNNVPEEDYFKYFQSIYRILNQQIPGVKIGGPGFTIDFSENRLESFISRWVASGCTPDFINLYVIPYVYDRNRIAEGKNLISPDRDFLANSLTHLNNVLERSGLSDLEVHVTIWNSTLSSHNVLNDSIHKGAYVMRNLINTWNQCDFIGYWYTSDTSVTNENDSKSLFGGGGLLSQSGIRKPAFHAYSFLDKLLPYTIAQSEHAIVTTNRRGSFAICCHNYKHYNALFYQKKEARILIEEQPLLFEDNDPLQIIIELTDLPDGDYWIRKRYVNENNGNIQASWKALNQMSDLQSQELAYIKSKSEPGLLYRKETADHGRIIIDETLISQEIMLIEIENAYL